MLEKNVFLFFKVICESGTGSGSLSHVIATAIAPTGHLYTHDIEEARTKKIEQEFEVCTFLFILAVLF